MGIPFPKDSLILLDEVATVDPNDPNRGLGWPPGKLAEAIHEMDNQWVVTHVHGVGDDSYGLEEWRSVRSPRRTGRIERSAAEFLRVNADRIRRWGTSKDKKLLKELRK